MEASPAIELAKHTLLAGGLILAVGIITSFVARKVKVPDIALFLLVGMAIGPQLLGLVDIKSGSALYQIIFLFGASYILFDGGTSLRFEVLKEVWITIVALATFGMLITAAVTGFAAFAILGVPWIVALLLGAVIAPTDPATLVPIFRRVKFRDRVAQTVMSESAFNDATGAIVAIAILEIAVGSGKFSIAASLLDLLKQATVGIIVGVVLGYLAALLIAHQRWAFLADDAPVVILVVVIGAYFAADSLEASGFMAVFVFGIMIGNKDAFGFKMSAFEAQKLDDFVVTTAFIMRLFIFLLLGSQVDFRLIEQYWQGGVVVVAIFMLVARPLTVFVCALPDRRARWSLNELLFMSWTRETGVIPAALAGLLLGMKAPGSQIVASVTFIAILMTILIQAPTTKWLGQKLGLLQEVRKPRAGRAKYR